MEELVAGPMPVAGWCSRPVVMIFRTTTVTVPVGVSTSTPIALTLIPTEVQAIEGG